MRCTGKSSWSRTRRAYTAGRNFISLPREQVVDCLRLRQRPSNPIAPPLVGGDTLRRGAHDTLQTFGWLADDPRPLDEESEWPATGEYSRAYLHHLVRSGETLGAMLLSEINVAYYQHLMRGMREAITGGTFETFQMKTRADWARGDIASR